MKRILFAGTAAVLLQACNAMPTFPEVESKTPIAALDPSGTRPVMIQQIVVDIQPGTIVARKMAGVQCGQVAALQWSGENPERIKRAFAESFNTQLKAANYNVVGAGKDLFDNGSAAKAELVVGVIIDRLDADYCYPWGGVGVSSDVKGTSYIHLSWQVYDALSKRTVYRAAGEGKFNIDHNDSGGWRKYLDYAMDQSVRNLLGDPRFHQALTTEPNVGAQPASLPAAPATPAAASGEDLPLLIAPAQPAAGLEGARAATVTIFTAESLGSGVIVSPEGYILTNYHVVKDADRVRVKLADNRELLAQVLRRDSRRDVALLKFSGSGYPAAGLRLPPQLQVGDEVFAIGSPLLEQNALTVTRGIVSAFRNDGGYPLIQSDASIQHGNSGGPVVDHDGKVVALCVGAQMSSVDRSEGLNFFIPIDDAINRLHVRLK